METDVFEIYGAAACAMALAKPVGKSAEEAGLKPLCDGGKYLFEGETTNPG